MIFNVRVTPKSSRACVKQEADSSLKVHLTKPAQGGEANAQLIEVLAAYFGVRPYQIAIIHGQTSRNKVVEVKSGIDNS